MLLIQNPGLILVVSGIVPDGENQFSIQIDVEHNFRIAHRCCFEYSLAVFPNHPGLDEV